MAYTVAWNEASPAGSSTNANTIDTEFQNLKVSIRERMNDILHSTGDWGTDGEQPKVLNLAAALGGPNVAQLIGTPEVAVVYAAGAQVATTGSTITLLWSSETLDTTGLHSTSTNTGRFTIITAGYYRLVASIRVVAGSAAADASLRLRKNGSDIRITEVPVIAADSMTMHINEIVLAAAADYFDLQFYQASGQSMTVTEGAGASAFSIERLNGTT